MNPFSRAAPWVFAVLFTAAALGQDASPQAPETALEELLQAPISTASKYDQRMSDVAASVTVISAEEIARYGWRTLSEVLESVRGVYTTYDRSYTYLGVGGIGLPTDYNNRFLVLIDGIKMTESVSGSVGIDTTLALDLSTLARIEFVRGPGSVMYGTGAMFGVINLITKEEREPSSVTAGAGSAGLWTGAARAAFHQGELSGAVAVSWQDRKGNDLYFREFDAPETNHGVIRAGDGDRYHSVLATAAWKGVHFIALQSTRSKQVPTAPWGTTFGERQGLTDSRALVAIDVTRRLGMGSTLSARAYNDRFAYHGVYPVDHVEFTDRTFAVRTGAELRYVWDIVPTQRFTAGAEYVDNRVSHYDWGVAPAETSAGSPFRTASMYAQLESRLSRRVTVTAGASYDRASNARGQLTPRAAVIVKGSASTTLKLLYGQAFRSPSVYELSYEGSGFLHAGALRSEEIRTLELVLEQKVSPSVLVAASVFDESLTNLVRLQPVSADEVQYQNRGTARSRGFAVQVDARRNSGIWSYASYSWHRARELEERMVNSPLYLAKGGLSTPTSRRLYGGLELEYEGSRLTYAGNDTNARLLTNLNLGGTLRGAFRASVAVRNLFDVAYGTPGGAEHRQDILEQDGRTFVLSMKWTGR